MWSLEEMEKRALLGTPEHFNHDKARATKARVARYVYPFR